jgi:Outer membrane protein/protective antigen OMA87
MVKWLARSAVVGCLVQLSASGGYAQDSHEGVSQRVIFIGDAGEINEGQQAVIANAAERVLSGKTTVFFLGDNIYPRGMALAGDDGAGETGQILRSQFEPLRAMKSPVYFIPGNHDWDRMGKDGLAKIRAQGAFLRNQQDSQLQLLPSDGCPGPEVVTISDSLVVITFDSEWWLFPHQRTGGDVECACETEDEVIERLEEQLYEHRKKTILLAIHHPLRSYGVHGGYYSWKDHIFPLTELNPNLYFPLPVVGSLYPLLRKTVFLSPEDMPHPAYQALIRRVREVTDGQANIIHVAGHDHGLQFIQEGRFRQIVSGGGSRTGHFRKGGNALYAKGTFGFAVVDLLKDRSTRVAFYANDAAVEAFMHTIPYQQSTHGSSYVENQSIKADSVMVPVNVRYDEVGRLHRKLFGENYRKEWAMATKVPVLRLSKLHGGLRPIQRGGGMQTMSLRLQDPTGKQWVLRSVNKQSESLLPMELHHTLAHEFLDDANSAQHPYAALIFPPLAEAIDLPHTNPVIGLVAPDSLLAQYTEFANTICLLEEREPIGDSDNTPKMLRRLTNDNDDVYKAKTFLRARMLDLLVNDWDRHEDQWRWRDANDGKKGADRDYLGVPRDRDQALRKMEGLFPAIVSMPFALPLIQGIAPEIRHVHYSLRKSGFLNAHVKSQFSWEEWQEEVTGFVEAMTDSVLEAALRRLPPEVYELRHDELLQTLKARRDALPAAMDAHYRFINRIVDIRLSNKHERVTVAEEADGALRVTVRKINKEGEVKRKLMEKSYDPQITKEIRLYLSSGEDSVRLRTERSPIRVRIIGGNGKKHYDIQAEARPVDVYDRGEGSTFGSEDIRRRVITKTDSSHTAFVPVNLYNVWAPLVTAGYNADDGLLLGAGFRYTHQRGFRTEPFNHTQQFMLSGSFNTGALRMRYRGHWKRVIGTADAVIEAEALMPHTRNYFGLGNGAFYDRQKDMRYYRTRFETYRLDPLLQWQGNDQTTIRVGPSLQWYRFSASRNEGRFILQPEAVHTYDSLTLAESKGHAGIVAHFKKDTRNSALRPSRGGYFQADAAAYAGISEYARSFTQVNMELAVYAGLAGEALVLSNRIGGGATIGHAAFYQSQFLGGQGNLRGFRQYRFAGNHIAFNNLELRARMAYIGNYLLPGELGLMGFYDVGKVWADVRQNDRIQQGVGGGLYYIAANFTVLQAVVGHSREGWYPYFSLGFRF